MKDRNKLYFVHWHNASWHLFVKLKECENFVPKTISEEYCLAQANRKTHSIVDSDYVSFMY